MKNRLKLDFSIPQSVDRNEFLNSYINSLPFTPTFEELETMANYILYGRDSSGKNLIQLKKISDPTLKSLSRSEKVQSLEELFESDNFSEQRLSPLSSTSYTHRKETFSRSNAAATSPATINQTFQTLWNDIDSIDLLINFYDLAHNKRKEIRTELLDRFSDSELDFYKSKASTLSEYTYLKYRRLLIEKRREQYTLRDFYAAPIVSRGASSLEFSSLEFDSEIPVLPFLRSNSQLSNLIFNPKNPPQSYELSPFQKEIQELIYKSEKPPRFYFDFRNESHLRSLILFYSDLEEEVNLNPDPNSSLYQFLQTFHYYIERAELNPIQQKILSLRLAHVANTQINKQIKNEFQKNYTDNYISTIFQRILKSISAAATRHFQILQKIFTNGEFKKCICCGVFLPKDEYYFIRNHKCRDGFRGKCKRCERGKLDPYI